MGTKGGALTGADNIKANIRSISTCTNATVTALQELLARNKEEPGEKENIRVKVTATARRRAGTTATTTVVENGKQPSTTLAPKARYILATEVANATLKALTDALKSPAYATHPRPPSQTKPSPNENGRKTAKARTAHAKTAPVPQKPLKERPVSQLNHSPPKPSMRRRSSSFSSPSTSSPDDGVVAMAECARVAFAYLGSSEAARTLGKDTQSLQYENGSLVLIGKLVALGLDTLAVKELRIMKKRLESYLHHAAEKKERSPGNDKEDAERSASLEKESLASLLHFPTIDPKSPALPLVVNLQLYTLRIIAKLKRPRVIEAAMEYLKLSNPSSPPNLISYSAKGPNGEAKAARQLESFAQSVLTLCPSISSTEDANKMLPSPETVLLLQHLAFKVRRKWWSLAGHQGNIEQELWEPFAKCVIAFARRSQLSAEKKYQLAETLCMDLAEQGSDSGTLEKASPPSALLHKALSSLAQSAGLSDEALHWLGSSDSSSTAGASEAKKAGRLIRIATVLIDACVKGDEKADLGETISNALEALKGSVGGSASDLGSLFLEVNVLRRSATRLLVACISKSEKASANATVERQAGAVIASCVHFSARFVGTPSSRETDLKAQSRHSERIAMVRTCLKSIVDSVMASCKLTVESEDQWKELDTELQDCLHLLHQLDAESKLASDRDEVELIQTSIVKLSNAYWAKHVQLRKSSLDSKCMIAAMQRSIDAISSRSESEQKAGHLSTKLEQLGEVLEDLGHGKSSRKAFRQCIESHLNSDMSDALSQRANRYSIQQTFSNEGPLGILARVLKAYHRSLIKFSSPDSSELAFYDDDDLQTSARGALLECQLGLYLRTLSRNRQWDSNLDGSINALVERLREMYIPKKYPLRRLRLSIMLLQLSQTQAYTLPSKFAPQDNSEANLSVKGNSEDSALSDFESHLKAFYRLKLSLRQAIPSISEISTCFLAWDALVNAASSWGDIASRIDNVEDWLQDVQANVEMLNAKGEEYSALPILHFLVRVFDLRKSPDASDLVTILCALGLQLLRLGYTGKAGLSFAKAETVLEYQTTSIDAKLQWHISYSEYLLGIGNNDKCATTLAEAQSLALADRQFMDLAKPTTTLSGRVRFNRIMADASYVHSLYAAANGSFKEAARHARQSVALNRRLWAAFESKASVKKPITLDETQSNLDSSTRAAFDPLSSMRNDKGVPLVMSVTHDALDGPEFWSLVPALYRALMQHSQVFAHQGLLHEAIYVAEQAEKVATAINSSTLITDNASWRADCWAQSGRTDKAETILNSLSHLASRKSLSVAGYHSALARVHHFNGQFKEELASYDILAQLLGDLSAPEYIESLETFSPPIDALAKQMSSMSIDGTETAKAKPGTRGRKPAAKSTSRTAPKTSTNARQKAATAATTKRKIVASTPAEPSGIAIQCSTLGILRAAMMDRGVLASILQDDLVHAFDLLGQAEKLQSGSSQEISHMWAAFKARFAQSIRQIAENITVNTLPDSTIAFPAIGLKEQSLSDNHPPKGNQVASSASSKGVRAKKQTKVDFLETLCDAREFLVKAHKLCASNGSNHLFQQISSALGHVTILLSAVVGTKLPGSLHPLYAAYMSEIPKSNALRLAQESVEAEKEPMSRDECVQWPVFSASSPSLLPISDFQQEYIDIIPETWAAVSLALNEDHSELYVTRFEKGSSPFVLRLPLSRHVSREVDEEEFTFADGKGDFDELIELSDFSTKTAKDMTSREARQQWWAEREALDTRLHELLLNIENIWLGGFKGIFSQHERQPLLLTRFRKSLENILNQHLPSRARKNQQKQPQLDSRVLELFIGLGDATDPDLDLDESLMDLIYFVVDILQFNGERNAYDEIDFDTMVVETYDALRAYYSAYQKIDSPSRHTILILDKSLHAFPWESLPCLEQLSISRLPSLAALHQRLRDAKSSRSRHNAAPGHYIRAEAGGTTILNPSGDLSHTLKTLQPQLDVLEGPWDHIKNRAPSEKEFEDSLREQELVLYFGHGSGAQYIKSKSVRRLYPGQQDAENREPGCATTLLFGCSSVHLTENGIYEPTGMLSSYLTAGAPAVVGMLWDVTDKDCDRFAVRAGELWGLWPKPQEEPAVPKTPGKTPARKTKGKSKAVLPTEDLRGAKSAGSLKRADHGNARTGEETNPDGDRSRGVGLDEAVREARSACVLRYLNGAAAVVYGIPVYIE